MTRRLDARSRSTASPASRARARCTSAIDGRRSSDVQLRIYEPPRFFEAFLRGRAFTEVPGHHGPDLRDLPDRLPDERGAGDGGRAAASRSTTARSATLRRLIYCGEWIESHGLHVYMLHAPDFLGYESAIAMARRPPRDRRARPADEEGRQHADARWSAGARSIPINVRVGGFYRAPDARRAAPACRAARARPRGSARDRALDRRLPFPDVERDHELVALHVDGEYPIDRGRIVSSAGLDIGVEASSTRWSRSTVRHSNALHARIRERGSYLTGPLARFNLDVRRALARGARSGAGGGVWAARAAIRSRASSCAPSRCSTRARRRCG